jgi:hypothetical protein
VISIVVPVYNEKLSLTELHGEIAALARQAKLELEVIFVDDGSTDGSWEVIGALAGRDERVRGLRLRRNFGKAAALSAGFRACRGDVVVTLDADLQDDPAEIPFFLSALEDGLDMVSGWKRRRHDPWHKVWPSRVFNWLVGRLTGVRLHDHNCGLKCYRADVVRELRLYGELHRFIPVLAAARGFRVGELEVQHRPRKFGHSKYGVRRFLRGLLDLLTVKFLTTYGRRPQHCLGGIGLGALLAGGLGAAGVGLLCGVGLLAGTAVPLAAQALLVGSAVALLLGGQLLVGGLLAEMLTADRERQEDGFCVAEETHPRPAVRSPHRPHHGPRLREECSASANGER